MSPQIIPLKGRRNFRESSPNSGRRDLALRTLGIRIKRTPEEVRNARSGLSPASAGRASRPGRRSLGAPRCTSARCVESAAPRLVPAAGTSGGACAPIECDRTECSVEERDDGGGAQEARAEAGNAQTPRLGAISVMPQARRVPCSDHPWPAWPTPFLRSCWQARSRPPWWAAARINPGCRPEADVRPSRFERHSHVAGGEPRNVVAK
jgi:hypothetical protein